MIVRSIELSNFRNYESLSMEFSDGINILYGDNAQGKTNILEAVYLCGTTKSHKGVKDKDMVRIGSEEAHLRLGLSKHDFPHRIDLHLRKSKTKGVAIDGIPIRKTSEIFGLMNVIVFSPEDLSMIKNGPSERRRFIDLELCQLEPLYLHNLSNYNKVLEQRNNLLKQIGFNRQLLETIDIWDMQLANFGANVISARKEFINDLNAIVGDIHARLSGGKEQLKVRYDCSVTGEELYGAIKKSTEKDLTYKSTSVGPHRDDISFYIGDNDLKKYGSQGQQRTAALSLKLAEIELVKRKINDNPILLLDDVLSELDRKRQHHLLDSIEGIQTVITCTGLEEFIEDRSKYNCIYEVAGGSVKKH